MYTVVVDLAVTVVAAFMLLFVLETEPKKDNAPKTKDEPKIIRSIPLVFCF